MALLTLKEAMVHPLLNKPSAGPSELKFFVLSLERFSEKMVGFWNQRVLEEVDYLDPRQISQWPSVLLTIFWTGSGHCVGRHNIIMVLLHPLSLVPWYCLSGGPVQPQVSNFWCTSLHFFFTMKPLGMSSVTRVQHYQQADVTQLYYISLPCLTM